MGRNGSTGNPDERGRQMGTRRVVAITLALVILVGALGVPFAAASVIVKDDGNDTRGPLDLASVRISHAASTTDAIRITTIAPFANKQIDGERGNFVLLFSRDGGAHVQWVGYVFYADGALRGIVIDRFGHVSARPLVHRTSPRSVVFLLRRQVLANRSYRLVVGSAWRRSPCSENTACVDVVPNRGSLLHDVVDPRGRIRQWPSSTSTTFVETSQGVVSFPMTIGTSDDRFGSGVRSWALQRRRIGTTSWVTIGTGPGTQTTVTASASQGYRYAFRLAITDRQGNRRLSDRRLMTIPVDDSSGSISFDGPWTPATSADWYLGTGMVGQTGAHLSYTFDANSLCFILRPTGEGTATASYLVTGGPGSTSYGGTLTATEATSPICALIFDDATSSWTFDLTVTSATPFVVDGLSPLWR